MGSKQIQSGQGAWGHARQTTAPAGVKSHEKAQAKTMDPSRGLPPNSGQTAGGSRQGGKKGGGKD